eukprot:TRINITY_DN20661_c0_g1_i1.p1 TRINITY_DN20661_c0_g1~~TRINITY_DN20661_c0_g1_i1.p1  ORF type:complete len:310 (+),score=92.99 TRINITY_DN20661_c0_g1_i1:88-930(+)
MAQRGSPTGGAPKAAAQPASKERVKGFFKKFNENKLEDAKRPQRGAPAGGAAGLVTQNQQVIKTTSLASQSAGRNFSPVNASDYEPLLPPPLPHMQSKHLLVLDIDETLVHSSFKPVKCDLVLAIEIDGTTYQVYVKKRPHVDDFIKKVGTMFECSVFTASLSKYAMPLMDQLDPGRRHLGHHRLFREHCSHTNGAYVKDLSLLGRPLHKICIIDNSPVAYLFQPRNALPCTSYFDDNKPPNDNELRDFIPLLERMSQAASVYDVLDEYHEELAALEQGS